MIWIYVFALAVGTMLLVPTVLQAIERRTADPDQAQGRDAGLFEFAAFAATAFGAAGIVVERFDPRPATSIIAALTIGLAAGAIHPEVLTHLSGSRARR